MSVRYRRPLAGQTKMVIGIHLSSSPRTVRFADGSREQPKI